MERVDVERQKSRARGESDCRIIYISTYFTICILEILRVVHRILWQVCPHHLDEFLSVASLEQLHTGVGIRNHQLEWIPWPICIFLMSIPAYPEVEQGLLLRKCVSGWDREPFDREWYNLLMQFPISLWRLIGKKMQKGPSESNFTACITLWMPKWF